MIRSLALIRPVPVNPRILDHSALVNHHVVNLAGLPGERRPVHAGVVVRAERVVKCDRTVVQFSLQISRDKIRILNQNLNKNYLLPDRFAVLVSIVTVEVPGEKDPAAGPPVLHHGVSDGHGRPQQLVSVTQTQVSVEEVNLASG